MLCLTSPSALTHTVHQLIDAVKAAIVPFIRTADEDSSRRASGAALSHTTTNALIAHPPLPPANLSIILGGLLPESTGLGKHGFLHTISQLLLHSVNTWDQGFLDKLYSAPSPVGLASELLLAALNTNVHVYSVSPALTALEKTTAQRLARLFGFRGAFAGGVTCAGGSASNLTSLITARSHLHPSTKTAGNGAARFVVFTSAHGHYSVDKAAIIAGLGKDAVWLVPVDATGRMIPAELAALVARAKAQGFTPLYVNATAGTTVLGSYDPFLEISAVCKREGLWMHVDASWGGPVVFSEKLRAEKLRGVELADSVTVNPHKMMNVPVTCSFLLGPDMRVFHGANRTDAPYLFHGDAELGGEGSEEVWDLADLTLQCGRRGDAIKLALAWVYYGPAGFESQINKAFELAALLAEEIKSRDGFVLVGQENPPPCLQVCFYHKYSDDGEKNTRRTAAMVKRLAARGFMVDYASFPKAFGGGKQGGGTWKGSFFRVVVNIQTRRETVLGLVKALEEVGSDIDAAGEVNA